MEEKTKQAVINFINSEVGESVKTLIAFAILKSKTTKDDEILNNIDEVVSIIAEKIGDIAAKKPSDKDAKLAAMKILKKIVESTETKWDDRAYSVLNLFV